MSGIKICQNYSSKQILAREIEELTRDITLKILIN